MFLIQLIKVWTGPRHRGTKVNVTDVTVEILCNVNLFDVQNFGSKSIQMKRTFAWSEFIQEVHSGINQNLLGRELTLRLS